MIAAFDRSVGIRSITLEGDTYDSSGQLTGGSTPKIGRIIDHVSELRELQEQVSIAENELKVIEKKYSDYKDASEKYKSLKNHLELNMHEHSIMKKSIETSHASIIAQEIETLKDKLSKYTENKQSLLKQRELLVKECEEAEKDLADYSDIDIAKLEQLKVFIATPTGHFISFSDHLPSFKEKTRA